MLIRVLNIVPVVASHNFEVGLLLELALSAADIRMLVNSIIPALHFATYLYGN